jgi:HlyD family secretion protein
MRVRPSRILSTTMKNPSANPWPRRVLIGVVIVAALAALVWWLGRPKPVKVVLTEVGRGTVESTISNTRAGTVEACQRTKLSTIAGGRIEVLAVKEGDKVRKGQLLMQLWNDDQQAEQRLTQAALETARKRVIEACTVAENAVREAERRRDLFRQGFISESAYDTARVEADARSAACTTAKTDVAQAQARVEVARVARGRTVLIAPFDGTVAKIVGEVGEYSTPSPPGVATPPAIDLIDDSCLYVEAPMDEVDAPKIRIGQPVRITLDALPKRSFPGKVKRVAPYVTAVEKQARTVDIEATFDDPASAGRLLVGYSADVEIILDVRQDVLRVPTSALLEGGRVLLLEQGKLAERKVKSGVANWEYTEIVDGVAAGDRIVTSLEREGVKAGAVAVEDGTGTGK